MGYNLTNLTENSNDLLDIATEINVLSDGVFGMMFLFTIYLVVILVFKERFDTRIIGVVAGAATSLISIFMLGLGWIGFNVVIVPIVLFLGSLVYLISTK